ncbi:hypothetical protein TBLA_0A07680 [Henningerozyma blattae CBS 6284]|uniref:peptidyl-tRNA hydrolase n=1 Tax=Henningerozyma blattae (strain ATCC 34711 / CBS 6284 / DSM 70876 / NBRC 10599 / NRRL Y-10934 / UCD 77-7) TaxID=1071380 RepID=I2GWQ5_HENB6|nr:hypothetical protein TBLA_0A07680 [Tetrapisispora blattae CBS 6284]CCH58557.1 hypothetical protein TBLA_0A07680 [Tetrapisispora blattae CBS 6284]
MSKVTTSLSLSFLIGLTAVSLVTGYFIGQATSSPSNPFITTSSNKNALTKKVTNGSEDETEFEEEEEEEEFEVDSNSLNEIPGEVRMALIIRQDLEMTKGKIAAQCCHAALSCFRLIGTDPSRESYNLNMLNRWLRGGQAKITLKCPNKEVLDELYAKAISLGINATVIHDAGRTQIAAGSATVLGLGPAPKAILDQVTGELKLY